MVKLLHYIALVSCFLIAIFLSFNNKAEDALLFLILGNLQLILLHLKERQ